MKTILPSFNNRRLETIPGVQKVVREQMLFYFKFNVVGTYQIIGCRYYRECE